jgi:hypothetical protein
VEYTFRPLLEEISFNSLEGKKPLLSLFPGKYYADLENVNCTLFIVLRRDIPKSLGYTLFQYKNNMYRIAICLSYELFEGNKYNSPRMRNIIGIHEFLHCISAFLCIPYLSFEQARYNFCNRSPVNHEKEYNLALQQGW